MDDFIRLPRSALNDEMWRNKDLAALLCYLLAHADENGVFQSSLTTIAAELKITPQQFKTLWKKLENAQVATKFATKSPTKLATKFVLNIQSDKRRKQPSKQLSNQPSNQPSSNQAKTSTFSPPTRDEAQSYIDSMGFHWGDADLFLDFNEQKGWRLSDGRPMRDWKAAMRNWENRWKQKYGTRPQETKDRYAARRGTDAAAHTEADFGGPF